MRHGVSGDASAVACVEFGMNPIKSDPEIMSGVPCFVGTRVPVSSLFDHIERGYTIDEFLLQFPTVKKEQVIAVLELAKASIPHQDLRAAG